MNDIFRYTMIPVILGANFKSRVWATRLHRHYRVRSHIMSEHYHPALLFSLCCRFHRLYQSCGYTDFILSELIRFAREHSDKLLVIIGATPVYQALIRENRALLETYYILSDPALSFLSQTDSESTLYERSR